ncbi:unnamed protein product, partial [Allacma fusca]
MISPENLDQVIKILERRFGRPDIVIRTLIEKARKTPSPKEAKLEMLITFSNAVQNLVAIMRILKGTAYMLNPELTEELVSKLPSHLKLKWGKFVLKQSDPITLEHLANWLDNVANAASITSSFVFETDSKPGYKKDDRFKKKPETVLTVTEDARANSVPQQEMLKKCHICEKSSHPPDKCTEIKKLTVDERWKLVSNKSLCFHCLQKG